MTKLTPKNIEWTIADDKIIKKLNDGTFDEVTASDITALGFSTGWSWDIWDIVAWNTYTAYTNITPESVIVWINKERTMNKTGSGRFNFTVSVVSWWSWTWTPTIQMYKNNIAVPWTWWTYWSLWTFNNSHDVSFVSWDVLSIQSNNSWTAVTLSDFSIKFDVVDWSWVATVTNP